MIQWQLSFIAGACDDADIYLRRGETGLVAEVMDFIERYVSEIRKALETEKGKENGKEL